MRSVTVFLFATFLVFARAGAECETGWTIYKDELCIKTFPDLLTHDEAKEFCSTQDDGNAKASLVKIKDADLQNLLVNATNNIFNTLWLGGQYNETTGEGHYNWDDGDVFSYTNWQEGYPRNTTDYPCVELRPINAKADNINAEGKWLDANCQKRNQVMCQRAAPWTLVDAVEVIKRLREELNSGSKVIPIGSILIEYYNQPDPRTLWPDLVWEDVSSLYAGLFFRTTGGNSGSWGAVQSECAPRITDMQFSGSQNNFANPNSIPANGWSNYGSAGIYPPSSPWYYDGIRFYTAGCEVRPQNQAVRIWKRIA